MTPHWDGERWSNATCAPDRQAHGVTRHGTPLSCSQGGTWGWRAETGKGESCVDAGEWQVINGWVATVCRDGTWHQVFLENPTPTPSPTGSRSLPGPGKIPHP
jgi:hypothetical protein